jgi:uncharacterized damage-inducible protein DinB
VSRSVLQTLIEHLRWADDRIVAALRDAGTAPAEVLELFAHVLGAEHVWLARMHGRAAEVAVWPQLSVDDCATLAASNAGALAALVAPGDPLDRVVHYTNSAGVAFDSSLEEILVHVCMHGQYHRGQVNLLMRKAGLQPAAVDYIAFVRGAPAATRPL